MTGGPGIDSIIKHNAAMKAQNAELREEIKRLKGIVNILADRLARVHRACVCRQCEALLEEVSDE